MARQKSRSVQALSAVIEDVARELGPSATSALLANPEAVRVALAGVANALEKPGHRVTLLRGIKPTPIGADEAERRLAALMRPDAETELLNADEVAVRVGLKTRQSVHDWLKKKKILGWQRAKRGYVFPMQQFDEHGRPPEGLAELVAFFGDAFETWHWLVCPMPALDGATPLTRLRVGELDRVLNAARGAAQGDFA